MSGLFRLIFDKLYVVFILRGCNMKCRYPVYFPWQNGRKYNVATHLFNCMKCKGDYYHIISLVLILQVMHIALYFIMTHYILTNQLCILNSQIMLFSRSCFFNRIHDDKKTKHFVKELHHISQDCKVLSV